MPEINLVSAEERVRIKKAHLIKGLLVLVILVEAIWLSSSYQSWQNTDELADDVVSDLNRVQSRISSQDRQITALREQIATLQELRNLQKAPFLAVTSQQIAWDSALLSLFEARGLGIDFKTLSIDKKGGISLSGTAVDTDSIVAFQGTLRDPEGLLELLSFSLSSSLNPGNPSGEDSSESLLDFSATLRVK
ncbi:MAG: hypothetical protein IIB11_01645 [Chloroflexi bacterium]|nr:hypothetical protein [Chloroflexota bacterium]